MGTIKLTADQVKEIDNQETYGKYTVRRLNTQDFLVTFEGTMVCTGTAGGVADYITTTEARIARMRQG